MGPLSPRQAALLAAVAVAAAFTLALVAARALRRRGASRRAVRRARRALAGESDATRLLAAAGYAVLDTQLARTWTIHVDGAPVEIELRCDALVERDGRVLVAETKTGERAPSLATAATRRQLLEYAVAYAADGVLLVDPEAGAIREVDFALAAPPDPAPAPAPPPVPWRWLLAGAALGAITVAAVTAAL